VASTSAPASEANRDPRPSRVAVVIVNFNAGDYLAVAIDSVLAQGADPLEIIVVDNCSSDASVDHLPADLTEDGSVRVVRLDDNVGLSRACNVGLREAAGEEILLLNPDCRMFPGALAALRRALAERPEAGMAGARLINPDGSEQRGARRDIPNPWTIFCEVLRLHRVMPNHPRFRSFNRHAEALPEKPVEVPAISGACMLVRREAVAEVGHLDGAYFMHFEDLDWCLRFNEAGWTVLFVPDAVVEHTLGVCSASIPVRIEYEKHRSLVYFLRKHFTSYYPSSFMALVSTLVLARFLAVVPRLLLGRERSARAHAVRAQARARQR
jgi:GT2 family glycosyltransferase